MRHTQEELEDMIKISKKIFRISNIGWNKKAEVKFEKHASMREGELTMRMEGEDGKVNWVNIPWPIIESLVSWLNDGAYVSPQHKGITTTELLRQMSDIKYGFSQIKSGVRRIQDVIDDAKLNQEVAKSNELPEACQRPTYDF